MKQTMLSQLIKLPQFKNYPNLVKEVALEALTDMIFDLPDGDVDTVDDHYFYNLLRDRLYDEDGDVRLTGDGQVGDMELQAFLQDSIGSIRHFEDQIRDVLEQVLTLNSDVFKDIYEAVDLAYVRIGSVYDNGVLLLIEGETE